MAGGGGGKGGDQKSTTEVKLPKWMETAYKEGLNLAEARAKMGYVPYTGPEVAAFNPMQINSMQQNADIANMFGMGPKQDVGAMLPKPQTYAGGIQGYSSMPLYEEAQAGLGAKYPGLKKYLDSFFIDPVTGQMQANNPWDNAKAAAATPAGGTGMGGVMGPPGNNGQVGPFSGMNNVMWNAWNGYPMDTQWSPAQIPSKAKSGEAT